MDHEEMRAEIRRLTMETLDNLRAAGVARDIPSVMEMNYGQFHYLIHQAYTLAYVIDNLGVGGPPWLSLPDWSLSDMLKTRGHQQVEHITSELIKAGLLEADDLEIPDDLEQTGE